MEIQETKDVWVAWSNTDCTEGRGQQYPLYVCQSKACAIRMGKKGSVQGSNCNVTKEISVRVDNTWLIPGVVRMNTKDDDVMQEALEKRESVEARLKEAGFTMEDIASLKSR